MLAPAIVEAILDGCQPPQMTLAVLPRSFVSLPGTVRSAYVDGQMLHSSDAARSDALLVIVWDTYQLPARFAVDGVRIVRA